MPNCNYCGSELRPGLKYCGSCGAAVDDTLKRETVNWQSNCPFCGAKAHHEEGFCGECGKPLPGDYDAYVTQAVKAQRFWKKHNGLHLLWGLLPVALSIGMSYWIQSMWDALDSGQLPESFRSTLYYYCYDLFNLEVVYIILLAVGLIIIPVVWGIRRGRAFKKLGMTKKGYKHLLAEYKRLPEKDVRRVSETLLRQRRA